MAPTWRTTRRPTWSSGIPALLRGGDSDHGILEHRRPQPTIGTGPATHAPSTAAINPGVLAARARCAERPLARWYFSWRVALRRKATATASPRFSPRSTRTAAAPPPGRERWRLHLHGFAPRSRWFGRACARPGPGALGLHTHRRATWLLPSGGQRPTRRHYTTFSN